MRVAVIPTIGLPPTLPDLVGQLHEENVPVMLICNGGPECSRDLAHRYRTLVVESPFRIYEAWNFGMDWADRRSCLILNDDVVLAPGAATLVCDELEKGDWAILGFDYGPSIVSTPQALETVGTFRHGGVGGFAFGVRPDRCARVDERFKWWGGDDDLIYATVAKGGKVGKLYGAKVEHPQPSFTANARPDLLPAGWEANDRALLTEKYGGAW